MLSAIGFFVPPLITGVSAGVWTYYDASSRNAVYAEAIAAIVTVLIPAVLAYVYYRDRIGPRTHPSTSSETVAGAVAIGGLFAVTLGQVLSPPDPFTVGRTQVLLLPVGVSLGLLWMSRFASEHPDP